MTDRPDNPIVLFDGVCNFCVGSVQFIIRRDREGAFRFASLQSDIGRELALEHGVDPDAMNSLLLFEQGKLHLRSTAALRIARRLRFPWHLARIFLLVPRILRDPIYRLIAANRYRLFGKREECMIPTPEIRERFL